MASNISDNRLEIFKLEDGQISHQSSIFVGLKPVAIAVPNNNEVWVVNHLSDSVSVVELSPEPRVVKTILVGDEPRDIIFAGPEKQYAFITTARRGQNIPHDPALTKAGVGRPMFKLDRRQVLGEETPNQSKFWTCLLTLLEP